MTSLQYPNGGATFSYTFDSMGRPVKLTDNAGTPRDWVKDVTYNAVGQITGMSYVGAFDDYGQPGYLAEARTYNVRQQLTRQTTQMQYGWYGMVADLEYRFSDTQNNGRITQRKNWVSGEEVTYQYDSLNRLISAVTTGPEWGQSFGYDGFGNLLSQTVTKGSAPVLSVNVDGATNRITTSGFSYDANGNMTAMPFVTMSYDVENRVAQATHSSNGTDNYVYDPSNRRVWKQEPSCQGCGSVERISFYGVDGTLMQAGTGMGAYDSNYTNINVYFAGKLVWREYSNGMWGGVAVDRLGSVVGDNWAAHSYFPFGEEKVTTSQNLVKFATYYRDNTTALDYANQRYYGRTFGRFLTPDPYGGSANPKNPQSWNRYGYANGDPVNFSDPTGLNPCSADEGFCIDPEATFKDYGLAETTVFDPHADRTPPLTPQQKHWNKAYQKLTDANNLLQKFNDGPIPAPCQDDLGTIKYLTGIDLSQILSSPSTRAGNWLDGTASEEFVRDIYSPGSPEYVHYSDSMIRMNKYFQLNTGVKAETAGPGSALQGFIYFRPDFVNGQSDGYNAAFLMHEVMHTLGALDPDLMDALGIPSRYGSEYINRKLAGDCFGVQGNKVKMPEVR